MIEALDTVVEFDAIFGVPYSSNRPEIRESWTEQFGDVVDIPQDIATMEARLVDRLGKSLSLCRAKGQQLIVQEVGGFVVPLLHKYFRDQLHLVAGVVEITKQGVWRAQEIELGCPVLHCADSELKRLEAQRCGETIVRCVDGIARELGIALAGRTATVVGAGWIGSGVARALRRIDMVPAVVDLDPLKLAEARLDGFAASRDGAHLEESALVIGATGACSLPAEVLGRLSHGTIVASASSRQHEIDVEFLKANPSQRLGPAVEAFHLGGGEGIAPRSLLLVNDGFPANFIPGSGSVPDEIVETILAELIVLMHGLTQRPYANGIHRISREEERLCAEVWLELRDRRAPAQAPIIETRAPQRLEIL
ncbi:MAG: S-adenosylhomocysteine hydrolase [Pseudomonadota bacterium]